MKSVFRLLYRGVPLWWTEGANLKTLLMILLALLALLVPGGAFAGEMSGG